MRKVRTSMGILRSRQASRTRGRNMQSLSNFFSRHFCSSRLVLRIPSRYRARRSPSLLTKSSSPRLRVPRSPQPLLSPIHLPQRSRNSRLHLTSPVPLKLARELSSAQEAAGNRVDFEVAEDVKVHGLVLIPKGEMAWGTIVDAKPKRRLGRAGKLDVRIDEGERAPLRASQESKGKGR